MSLVAAGESTHPVVERGVAFLARSVRADGSWPIDTNLATWVTTLGINALARRPDWADLLRPAERSALSRWLLDQQYRERHVYTDADPGGWAWTDLPGGVPDADDTPGALLALHALGADEPAHREAAWRRHRLAAGPAERRRRNTDLLPRLGSAAVRPQQPRPDRPHAAGVDRLAAVAARHATDPHRARHHARRAVSRAGAAAGWLVGSAVVREPGRSGRRQSGLRHGAGESRGSPRCPTPRPPRRPSTVRSVGSSAHSDRTAAGVARRRSRHR